MPADICDVEFDAVARGAKTGGDEHSSPTVRSGNRSSTPTPRSRPDARPASCCRRCSTCSGRTIRTCATRSATACSPAGSCRTSCSTRRAALRRRPADARPAPRPRRRRRRRPDQRGGASLVLGAGAGPPGVPRRRGPLPRSGRGRTRCSTRRSSTCSTSPTVAATCPSLGWINATAHAADLLKFLVRNPFTDASGPPPGARGAADAADAGDRAGVRRRRGGPPGARRGRRHRSRDDQRRRAVRLDRSRSVRGSPTRPGRSTHRPAPRRSTSSGSSARSTSRCRHGPTAATCRSTSPKSPRSTSPEGSPPGRSE